MKQQLQESHERLIAALTASQTRTFRWEIAADRFLWDVSVGRLFEPPTVPVPSSRSEVLQKVHPDDRPALTVAFGRCATEGADLDLPFRLIPSDGSVRWVYAKGKVFPATGDHASYLVGAYTDITRQTWLEEAVRQKEILETILGNIPAMIVFYRPGHGVLLVNEAFRTIVGWSTEEIRERGFLSSCCPDPEYRERVAEYLKNPRPTWSDLVMRCRDGSDLNSSWIIVGLADGSKIGIGIDITQRKALETQQKRLLQELETERSLLTVKNGQLRALATQLTTLEQRERQRIARLLHEHFQQILVAAQIRLYRLRTARDNKEVSQEAIRIGELLEEAVEASRNLTTELYPPVLYEQGFGAALQWLGRRHHEQFNLRVEVFADPDAELGVADVRLFLLDAVQELLLNVVKHAETDIARVILRKAGSDALRLVVIDHGKGCDPGRLDSVSGKTDGLGLTYIRHRIELLGGSVLFDTAPGRGCCVMLLLPKTCIDRSEMLDHLSSAGESQSRKEDTIIAPAETCIRVIIADDHAIVRRGLIDLLHGEPDIRVVGEAVDGQEAVELALQFQPDVVIMDVSMPIMDGIEGTRQIAQRLPMVKIVGLSMHKDVGIEEAMKKAGASTYLCKGDASQELVEAIRRCRVAEV